MVCALQLINLAIVLLVELDCYLCTNNSGKHLLTLLNGYFRLTSRAKLLKRLRHFLKILRWVNVVYFYYAVHIVQSSVLMGWCSVSVCPSFCTVCPFVCLSVPLSYRLGYFKNDVESLLFRNPRLAIYLLATPWGTSSEYLWQLLLSIPMPICCDSYL